MVLILPKRIFLILFALTLISLSIHPCVSLSYAVVDQPKHGTLSKSVTTGDKASNLVYTPKADHQGLVTGN
ncbi:MAG: hypothetical protein QGG39_11570, partial [Candidatus Poribacteria bacterium]|nr:hypothetical protein [Candidatus Poribacteria bacterium]